MTATLLPLLMEDVRFRYPGRSSFAMDVPRLTLSPRETVMLLGSSGSGKSTLLSLICGFVAAQSGRIEIGGTSLAGLRPGARDRFRGEHIGVIFQQFNLLPYARVLDNILLPLQFAPARRQRVGDPAAEAERLCHRLRLPADVLTTPAGRLSTGQQQRVAVARALIGQPPLIIADEPVSALDADAQDAFLALLFEQVEQAGSSLLMVSHDPRLGGRFNRVLQLGDIAETRKDAA